MQFRRVLVLGATGRIGMILRKSWPADRALWQSRAERGPGWLRLDPLAEPAALARAAQGCGTVLCLAGVTPTAAAASTSAAAAMEDNTALAEAAIGAAAAAGARVLLASSAAVYGNRAGLLREDAPLAPVSDYGRAKAQMEARGADLAARLGVEVCSLRIGNVAGADAILGGWRPGFELDLFADGRSPRRSYIGPATLARVLGDLLAAQDLSGDLPGVLNVAAPGMVEMGALLDAAGLAWTPRPAPPGAIAEVELDVSALRGFTRLDKTDSLPQTLVAEWRALQHPHPEEPGR